MLVPALTSSVARIRGRGARRAAGARHQVAHLVCRAAAAAVTLALVVGAAPPLRPAAAAPAITGAGSTFAQIAIEQWRRDVARSQGLTVNYSGQGSSQGRRQFIAGTVDWASSDISFEPGEMPTPPTREYRYLPLVAGGTALMYNLNDTAGRRITNLQLSGPTIAAIFSGQVRRWDDAKIAGDNPGLAGRLPAEDIKAVVRQGGSGTSAVFTGYMAAVAPDVWATFAGTYGIPGGFTSTFPDVPGFIKQSGSDGIASFVSNPNAGRGSIGYAEAGYALQAGLPVAYVRNAAGSWTQPTARAVAVALLDARQNADGTQNLDGVYFNGRPEAYPISSYNYAVVPADEKFGFSKEKGDVLRAFVIYSVTEGQSKAAPLGYSPLPPNLVDFALQGAGAIPGTGAVSIPPLGNWGQYYQQLAVDQVKPQEPPPQGGGGGGGGGGPTGPTGGGGPGVTAAGPTGGGPSATAGGSATTVAAAGGGTAVAGGAGSSGAVAATDAGAVETTEEVAAGAVARAPTIDATGKVVLGSSGEAVDLKDSPSGLLVVAGLVLLLVVFVPPGAAAAGRRLGRIGR